MKEAITIIQQVLDAACKAGLVPDLNTAAAIQTAWAIIKEKAGKEDEQQQP